MSIPNLFNKEFDKGITEFFNALLKPMGRNWYNFINMRWKKCRRATSACYIFMKLYQFLPMGWLAAPLQHSVQYHKQIFGSSLDHLTVSDVSGGRVSLVVRSNLVILYRVTVQFLYRYIYLWFIEVICGPQRCTCSVCNFTTYIFSSFYLSYSYYIALYFIIDLCYHMFS
jgi:hypothetical protein